MALTHFSGPLATTSVQVLSNPADAVDPNVAITRLEAEDVAEFSLPNGEEGQEKVITATLAEGIATVTPLNASGFLSIDFPVVGATAHLKFINGAWVLLGTPWLAIPA